MYKYIGNGAFIDGIPSRDLTEEEAKEYGISKILSSGLWKKDGPQKERPEGNKMYTPKGDRAEDKEGEK